MSTPMNIRIEHAEQGKHTTVEFSVDPPDIAVVGIKRILEAVATLAGIPEKRIEDAGSILAKPPRSEPTA